MKSALLISVVLFGLAQPAPPLVPAGHAVVSGTTTVLQGTTYVPRDGIQVTVMRKALVTSTQSSGGGRFVRDYAAGTPVKVLFDVPSGQQHLPQLQSLSGKEGLRHDVHVTLYTIDEASKQGINSYAHVQAIIALLRADGVPDTAEPMRRLQALASTLG